MINILAAIGLISLVVVFFLVILLIYSLSPDRNKRTRRPVAHRPGEDGYIYDDD